MLLGWGRERQIRGGFIKMDTQDALNNNDRRKGIILLCQARALEDVEA
jgi:hypothetical protein